MEPSDRYLVKKIQEGVRSAFKELYDRYQVPIFSYVYRLVGNRAIAEELVQEAFIKVYMNINSYKPTGKVSSWIYAIAGNCAKSELRKRHLRSVSLHTPVSANGNIKLEDVLSSASGQPDDALENKELGQQVARILEMLPIQYKEVITLRDIQHLTYEEIAEIMQCSVRVATVRLSRARKAFVKLFNERFGQRT
jgi:RNA polymerase sigma-70 factor (ECF subfamily)